MLSIRMQSRVHEGLIALLQKHIVLQIEAHVDRLRKDGEDPGIIREIEEITAMNGAQVQLKALQNGVVLSPDLSCMPREDFEYPVLVCEVAYTEPEDDLVQKAFKYISGTNGAVKWVVGLKVEYPHRTPLQGWFWLWQAIKDTRGGYRTKTVIKRKVLRLLH